MDLLTYVIAGAVVLIGVAFLMHIRKDAKDAHGATRK